MKSFDVLGLNNNLMSKIKFLGLSEPTPIQYQAIPHILNGKDLMGLAQTGTGKTAGTAQGSAVGTIKALLGDALDKAGDVGARGAIAVMHQAAKHRHH